MKNNLKVFAYITICFLILFICFTVICFITSKDSNLSCIEVANCNDISNVTNTISESNILTDEHENIIVQEVLENVEKPNIESKISLTLPPTSTPVSNTSNNQPIIGSTNNSIVPSNDTSSSSPNLIQNSTVNSNTVTVDSNKNNNSSVVNKVEPITNKNEDTINQTLANTSYRKVNSDIIKEVVSILNSEISKNNILSSANADGIHTKAISATKQNAYKNTSSFTYLFVKDITKGKVTGNYTKFESRVKNTVGALGTYYVYAEDEYTYDNKGKNAYWSQSLVWIYIIF